VVLVGRASFSIAVMRLLQSRRPAFVIPAVIRGRKPRRGRRPPGCGRSAGGGRAVTSTPTRAGGRRCGWRPWSPTRVAVAPGPAGGTPASPCT
jgi:hypothetical protein